MDCFTTNQDKVDVFPDETELQCFWWKLMVEKKKKQFQHPQENKSESSGADGKRGPHLKDG